MKYSLLLIAVLFLSTGCVRREPFTAMDMEALKGSGKLYLLPLGDLPPNTVNDLASFYRKKYQLKVETLHSVPLPATAFNAERKQLVAERAIVVMKEAHPELTNDSQAILIGITNDDMYISKRDWQYSYSWREQDKYAVVSCARMLESNGRQEVTEELFLTRLRKMVTKNVGILYYGLPQSSDPRSVLYRNVLGISDLDNMGEEF